MAAVNPPPPPPVVSDLGEDRLVRELLTGLGAADAVDTSDDCAVLPAPGEPDRWRLLKTDCVIEGVHYLPDTAPERVGWKALCRVVSDFAAMGGGQPEHALVTVALRGDTTPTYARGLYVGLGRAATAFGVRVVGGETARTPGAVFLSVAVSGSIARAACVRRRGGQPGDALWVTGRLGGSFLNGRHLDFTPRLDEARWLTANFPVHAMMDLSDGLGADLPRLARASGGLGWKLDEGRLPLSPGADTQAAMDDGEDYELLFATAPEIGARLEPAWHERFPHVPLSRVGTLAAPQAGEPGPGTGGFDHFRRESPRC